MLKEAIQKISDMTNPQPFMVDGHTYLADKSDSARYAEVKPDIDIPEMIPLHSLDAVIKMAQTEALKNFVPPVYIEVLSPTEVTVFLQAHDSRLRFYRPVLYRAQAKDVPGWGATVEMPFDEAAVALQTRFAESEDRDYALRLLSQITTGAEVTYADNGVATSVVTKTGVSLQQNQTIRPIIKLRPYRTFQEVEQPGGLFLIRINQRGIKFIEADGGMWKLNARKTVVKYLTDALSDEVESGTVVVML